MKSKYTIAGIILATLVLGILLGAVGSGALMEQHRKRDDSTPPSDYFLSHIDQIIQPDSSQRTKVDEIVHRTADRITVLFDQHRMEMSMVLDSMKEVLLPLLRRDQQQRLEHSIAFGDEEQEGKKNLGSIISYSYEYGEHLQQELHLDSMQTERIMAIIRAEHVQFRYTMERAGNDTAKIGALEHALFDRTSAAIQHVLTPEQKELFREKQSQIREYSEDELSEEGGN